MKSFMRTQTVAWDQDEHQFSILLEPEAGVTVAISKWNQVYGYDHLASIMYKKILNLNVFKVGQTLASSPHLHSLLSPSRYSSLQSLTKLIRKKRNIFLTTPQFAKPSSPHKVSELHYYTPVVNLFYPFFPLPIFIYSSPSQPRIRDGLIESHTSSQLSLWLLEDIAKILKLLLNFLLIS